MVKNLKNLWLRKIIVGLVTVLTLGMVTPVHLIDDLAKDETKPNSQAQAPDQTNLDQHQPEPSLEEEHISTTFVSKAIEQANLQAIQKFGPSIHGKIGDKFQEELLPKFEEVIETLTLEYDEETLRNLIISENPAQGLGEKIFHIYDGRTGKDLVRFHVRRDHPPQDGFWFNFHYHKDDDNYQVHHEIGKIYWGKNTPPKWYS